jgi:hypothetical protein
VVEEDNRAGIATKAITELAQHINRVNKWKEYDDKKLESFLSEMQKNVITHEDKKIIEEILSDRSKARRKHEVFSKGQAWIIVASTFIIAACTLFDFLIQNWGVIWG